MRTFLTTCTAMLLLCGSAAAQDEEETPFTKALSGTHLEIGSGMLFSQHKKTDITRYNMYFMPRLSFYDRLYIAPRLNLSTTNLHLKNPEDLPLNVDMTLPWQLSVGFDVRYRQPIMRWLDAIVFARFEFPASENIARIDKFSLNSDDEIVQNITLDDVQEHLHVTHQWRQLMVGITLMAHVGWWHPVIDFGYMSMVGQLVIAPDSEANALLDRADLNLKRFYETNLTSVFYAAGSEFDLGRGFRLRTTATFIRRDEGWLLNAEAGLVIPFELSSSP